MFERFCALLLRLYPTGFRDAYGREALQLMRDRARHERGVIARTRLLADLAGDLCMTSLRGWHATPEAPAITRVDGGPRFDIIEVRGPRPESLLAGMLVSTLMLAGSTLLFQAREFPPAPSQVGDGSGGEPVGAESDEFSPQAVTDSSQSRQTLSGMVAAHLREHYTDRKIGAQLADAVLTAQRNGAYESAFDGELAARMSTTILNTAGTLGIPPGVFVAHVVYVEQGLPTGPPPPQTAESRERFEAMIRKQNCQFERIDTLPGNVGYLKINGFAPGAVCEETARRAMASVNGASALIIDLRDNRGGMGDRALQVAGYLFDRPTHLYDPRPNTRVPPNTASPVSGNKLASAPVYLLTSTLTMSAAEYFAYNLKMLKRVTIVGERTAGEEHAGGFYRLTENFGMGIMDGPRPPNAFPIKGWEVIGVEPDVKASRADALDEAMKLIQARR